MRVMPAQKPKLVRDQSPPPEHDGEVGVLAAMTHGGKSNWLRVGVATVELGHGRPMLRVHLGAIPDDRDLYIPLGDVLTLCDGRQLTDSALGQA